MARLREIVVDPESDGQRLDAFLSAFLQEFSRAFLQKLIAEHQVLVDGLSAKASLRIKAGQRLLVTIPAPVAAEPEPQAIRLDVVFEDADLIVVNKPSGLVVHPAPGHPDRTLVNALLHHCKDLSGIGGVERPGIVHRLDRNTSGLLVVAKHDKAHHALQAQFAEHSLDKRYLAFAVRRQGMAALSKNGSFDTLYGRHPVHRKRFSSTVSRGKRALTHYHVLERFLGKDLEILKLELDLKTGRTHQIRVHLCDAGHPILGDKLYAGRSLRGLPQHLVPERQALHAWRLRLAHPMDGRNLEFEAPLPDDLQELQRRIRRWVKGEGGA